MKTDKELADEQKYLLKTKKILEEKANKLSKQLSDIKKDINAAKLLNKLDNSIK